MKEVIERRRKAMTGERAWSVLERGCGLVKGAQKVTVAYWKVRLPRADGRVTKV